MKEEEMGLVDYVAHGSSSCPGGGIRGDRWPAQSPESRIQRCRSLSPMSPLILISNFLLAVFRKGAALARRAIKLGERRSRWNWGFFRLEQLKST